MRVALALALLLVAAVALGQQQQKVIDVEKLRGEVDKGLKDAVVGLKVLQVVVIAAAMGVIAWGVLTHQPISQLASSRWVLALFVLAAIIVALQVAYVSSPMFKALFDELKTRAGDCPFIFCPA